MLVHLLLLQVVSILLNIHHILVYCTCNISLLAIQSNCVDASELLHAPVMPSLRMLTTGDELNEAHVCAHFEAG